MDANKALEKKLNKYAWIASIAVFLLVVFMRKIPRQDFGIDFSFLPAFYSSLNGIVAVLLIAALYFIKNKKVEMHERMMTFAMILSTLFLLCYVIYHITNPETKFCQEGSIRYVYFFLLITHIVLAAVILPFILFTYIRAYTKQFERHKKIAKWVYPFWLYVAITGPVLYLMLKPCYGL